MKPTNQNEDTTVDPLNLETCRQVGFEHARMIPQCNLECVHDGMDESEAYDACMAEWSEAEENSRQFSPFEFTAHELNEAPNSEEAWEAFDEGIADAFKAGWNYVLRRYTFK